jgi:hypothetical protein
VGKSGPGRKTTAMKKMLVLTMAMVLVGLYLGSVALAQTTVMDAIGVAPTTALTTGPLAPSGGPWILLPIAALVLGTGVLTYTIFRRDR